jgi:hypothetical protein
MPTVTIGITNDSPVDELDKLDPFRWPMMVLQRELDDLLGLHIHHAGQRHLHQLGNKRLIAQTRRAMALINEHRWPKE